MADYDVRQFDTIEDLLGLRDDWDRLLAETPRATFFQSLDWLGVFWKHFGDARQLRVLVVYHEDQPIGIVPMTIYWEKSRIGSVRVLGYPLDNWGTSFGPIGSRPRETLVAALSWIRQERRDWEVLDLRWAEGPIAAATEAALRQTDFQFVRNTTCELSWIDLTAGWDTYWASRTGKLRNNVRRNEKRLAEIGCLESTHCRPTADDPRWDLYEHCETVASRSWQATVMTGNTMSDLPVSSFLRDVHREAVATRAANINLLTLDDQPIAFSYDYALQRHVYGLRMGFDPAFARTGPGAVLIVRSLQAYCKQGEPIVIDLGETPSAYKSKWRTRTSTSVRFCHYPRDAWRAQLLCWKRRLFDSPSVTFAATS